MAITEEILTANNYTLEDAEAALACFETLFGEDQGLDEAILGAMMTNPDFVAALEACLLNKGGGFGTLIEACIADAIVDEDGPFTKEWLGTIMQGTDPSEELVAPEAQESGFTTSTGIKLLSVKASRSKTVVGEVAIERG